MEKARQITIEMLKQRGFNEILKDDEILKLKNTVTGNDIVVFFDTQQKLNKGSISKYMSSMKDEDNNHSIIVYMDSITNMTSKSVDQSIEMKIELFCMNELQFNITKHRLQPAEFKALTKQESRNFKIKFGQKLPIMRKTDPICRFYDFDSGDIVQITDRRGVVNYRIVR